MELYVDGSTITIGGMKISGKFSHSIIVHSLSQ
jgi:hypothetical protein